MNSYIKIFLLCVGIISCNLFSSAQSTTYSGYFLDNYDYRFQMNPAFGNRNNFVAMPALGNLNIHVRGTLHASDILYVRNGKTVLFNNPQVNQSEALSKFGVRNRLGTNEKIDIISFGFKAFGGYNAFSISALANVNVSIPGSFFHLAKEGLTNKTYDIENMFGNANAYAQVALNHSRDIKQVPGLRVGATLKVLVGAGNLDFDFNEAKLQLNEDRWIAQTNANIYASIGGFRFDMDHSKETGKEYVSGGNLDDGFKPQGFGVGLDLGAEYKWSDFKFSAAILDLGFISWGKTQWASTNGVKTVDTGNYIFNADSEASNSFKHEFDRLKDDVAILYQLDKNPEIGNRTRSLATTLNFAAEYEFPYYHNLHFGLLNSTNINGRYTWTQFRLSANVAPVKFFSADVNAVAGSYGVGFGWLINIHPKGFNLFLGMDRMIGKLAKQGVPLNSNASFNMGINFPF